jgi:hypothetical protein
MAESFALKSGWDSHPGYSLQHFDCLGKVTPRSDRAQLGDFRFRWSSSGKYEVNVCFKRGAKWFVAEMRNDSCPL